MPLRTLLAALVLAVATTAAAQPTWRFHLAFEDGTGAKDTIWLVYDAAATIPYSHWPVPLGQYDSTQNSHNYGDGEFHVFLFNSLHDTTNAIAHPYSIFPIFETGGGIDALNWTPPMTITWDTSLFHAPYLPYSQGHFGIAIMNGIAFSQFDQGGQGFGIFNMLIEDSVTIDLLWDYLFPIPVYFDAENTIGIREGQPDEASVQIRPNPARATIRAVFPGSAAKEFSILDLSGRRLIHLESTRSNDPLDISTLVPGTYIIRVRTDQNLIYHGTFEKAP